VYADNIVIAGWFVIAAIGFIHWQKTTTLFPRPITTPKSSEKLGAADFKPFQVVGIIRYPHGIGIAIQYSLLCPKGFSHYLPTDR
jgi:hypothetical protein